MMLAASVRPPSRAPGVTLNRTLGRPTVADARGEDVRIGAAERMPLAAVPAAAAARAASAREGHFAASVSRAARRAAASARAPFAAAAASARRAAIVEGAPREPATASEDFLTFTRTSHT